MNCSGHCVGFCLGVTTPSRCSGVHFGWSAVIYLDVAVEDGLGESLQRRTLVGGETGLQVEQRDTRRVSGQGGGVTVA